MKYYILDLKKHEDARGSLIAFEENANCPFDIKRAFFMYNNDINSIRGNHANKNSQFLLICIKGQCEVDVSYEDTRDSFILNSPDKALYINKMVWKEIKNFSQDAILLVLSSEKYDSEEYIRE